MIPTTYLTAYGESQLTATVTRATIGGVLPDLLDTAKPGDAVTRITAGLSPGRTWEDSTAFQFVGGADPWLYFNGEPALRAIAFWRLGAETVWLFDARWVAVVNNSTGAVRLSQIG